MPRLYSRTHAIAGNPRYHCVLPPPHLFDMHVVSTFSLYSLILAHTRRLFRRLQSLKLFGTHAKTTRSSYPNNMSSYPNSMSSYPNNMSSYPNSMSSYPNNMSSYPNNMSSYPNTMSSYPNYHELIPNIP